MSEPNWGSVESIAKAKKEFELYANPLNVEYIGGIYYAFCSELASLRLLQAYRFNKKANAGYSKNLNSYYFALEVA